LLAACATHQENPNYAYSTTYKAGQQATTQTANYVQSAPVSYQSAATTTYASSSAPRVHQDCLRKEKNHELIGAALGGSLGAFAGKELIGGTTGLAVGAGLGGAAGYGIGDKTVNCDPQIFAPQPVQASAPTYSSTVSSAPTVSTASSYQVPATHEYASNDQSRVVYQSPRIEYQSPTDTEFVTISEGGTPGYQVLQSQVISQPAPVAVAQASQIIETSPVSTSVSSSGAQLVEYDYSDNVVSANAFTTPQYSETRILGGGSQATHLVKQGDTVYSMARRLCVGVNDIQAANGLNSNFAIKIGQTLKLPASRC